MTRSWYRLVLTGLCALAAWAGPVFFLEDRLRAGYLVGGFSAAILCWGLLLLVQAAEPRLGLGAQSVIGIGASFLSWVPISLVAALDIIPHIPQEGYNPFDPVWIMGGFSPLVVLAGAWWKRIQCHVPFWEGAVSCLFRFSVPLFGLRLAALLLGLPKQYGWLFMFTGVMFLVLDVLGLGEEFPLRPGSPPPRCTGRT